MTNFDYMWLRDHMENLIKSLGFKSGYLPDGWQPQNAMESDINDKITALSYRLDLAKMVFDSQHPEA